VATDAQRIASADVAGDGHPRPLVLESPGREQTATLGADRRG